MSADLSPQGFLTDDNVFILERDAVSNLISNICTGVLLPTTEEEYRARLSLSGDVEDLPQPTRLLLDAYTPVSDIKTCAADERSD